MDSNKTAKAKVVETDPYAYVYRRPNWMVLQEASPRPGAEPVPNPIDPGLEAMKV